MNIQFKLILVGFVVIAILMAVVWYFGVLNPVRIVGDILVVLAMGVFVSRAIVKPLKELQQVAAQIIAGDYTARAEVKGKDEIAELAGSFNVMTDSLIESRKLPENILRSMKDALFVVDTNGSITEVNQAAVDVLGYNKEELLGKPVSKVFGTVRRKTKTPNVEKQQSDRTILGVKEHKQKPKVIKYIPAPNQEDDEEKSNKS